MIGEPAGGSWGGVAWALHIPSERMDLRRALARSRISEEFMGIEQFIDNEVKSNDVVLFMKGTPQFPMCGFSGQVVQILDHLGVPYKGLNVLESDDLRQGIKAYSNWPTIPAALCQGRVRRRLRHHPRDVPGRRAAGAAQGKGRAGEGKRLGTLHCGAASHPAMSEANRPATVRRHVATLAARLR